MKRLNTHGNGIQSTFNHHGGVLCLYPEGTRQLTKCNQEAFIARFDATDNAFFKRSYDKVYDLDKSEVLLYPNPNNGLFTLNFGSELSGDLTVYNAMGQSVLEQRFAKTNRMHIEIPQPPGIYVFKLLINEERVYGKFVIQ